jgi:hypothetical protein
MNPVVPVVGRTENIYIKKEEQSNEYNEWKIHKQYHFIVLCGIAITERSF